MRAARLVTLYAAVLTALSVLFPTWPPGSAVLVCALGLVTGGAIVIVTGIALHRPPRWRY